MSRYLPAALGVVCLGLLAWGVARGLEQLAGPPAAAPKQAAPAVAPASTPHITATLFYGTDDGESLVGVRREVPLAEGVLEQGREIIAEQLLLPEPPYVSVIPEGTMLRAFYITDRGDAFVDLSEEVSTRHPGGSSTELLTVYAIVNAVTANLPTIQRVQILINGKEAETLAGHIDLRRPLQQSVAVVAQTAGTQ